MNVVLDLGQSALIATTSAESPRSRVNAMATFLCVKNDVVISQAITSNSGVYVLYDEVDVLYVGQSENVKKRISSHTNIPFTEWLVAYTEIHNLIAIEALSIGMLRPLLNHKNSQRYEPITGESICHE